MSKDKSVKKESADQKSADLVRDRVGIFMKPWKFVARYGINSLNVSVKNFRVGQLVFNDDEIKSLKAQGAPLRVYVYDVESNTGGIN